MEPKVGVERWNLVRVLHVVLGIFQIGVGAWFLHGASHDDPTRVCLGVSVALLGLAFVFGNSWAVKDSGQRRPIPRLMIFFGGATVGALLCSIVFSFFTPAVAAGLDAASPASISISTPIAGRCELVVRVGEESESCWSQVCASEKPVHLGCDLSALRQVVAVSASPDRKWLAVLSVGEGHPMLEVVALDALTGQREYRVMTTINPYPGTIGLADWQDGELRVVSDMPLPDMPITDGDPLARMGANDDVYALDLASWKIRRVEPAKSQVPGTKD